MIRGYEAHGGNLIGVFEVPDSETHQYGIVGVRDERAQAITEMVEKPAKGTAPSNLRVIGPLHPQPGDFRILETQERGAGGEIQLTDAMITLARSQPFFAHTFSGEIYDTGTKLGFLMANVAYALGPGRFGTGAQGGNREAPLVRSR